MSMKVMSAFLSVMVLSAACVGDEFEADDAVMSWEEYEASAKQEFEGNTFYRVEGDLPVTQAELRQRYERYVSGQDIAVQASTVNRYNGVDDIWTATEAQNLTYCVSDEFGSDKARMVSETAQAAADWERYAGVDFIYQPAHDSFCNNNNPAIVFSVRPWNNGGGCAFFPNQGTTCVDRSVMMDLDDLDNNSAYGAVTSLGVMRHELGHVLGLRHEHIQYSGGCSESSAWRAVTAYDSESVMHYPWCAGATNTTEDIYITRLDGLGVDKLYPKFSGCNDEVYFQDGPYASHTNGTPFVETSTYLDYPVYQKQAAGYTWSIYRRSDGNWYLDFDGVDETWSGTVAHSTTSAQDPWSATWSAGGASQVSSFELTGGVYPQHTNGTWTLTSSHSGGAVYTRNNWSLYRRSNGQWHVDFNAVSDDWSGTVSYTSGDSMTPWHADWNNGTSIAPTCTQ